MGDPIEYTCPGCDATLKIPSKFAGKRGICNHCRGEIHVPAVEPASFTPDSNPHMNSLFEKLGGLADCDPGDPNIPLIAWWLLPSGDTEVAMQQFLLGSGFDPDVGERPKYIAQIRQNEPDSDAIINELHSCLTRAIELTKGKDPFFNWMHAGVVALREQLT